MNTRQKGRAFVKKIIEILDSEFGHIAHEVVGSGSGTREKGDIRINSMNLVIEGKDHAKISMAEWTSQTEKEGMTGDRTALIWRHPASPSANPEMRVDISMEYYIELLKKNMQPKTENLDRQFRYKVERLKQAAHEVIKELP